MSFHRAKLMISSTFSLSLARWIIQFLLGSVAKQARAASRTGWKWFHHLLLRNSIQDYLELVLLAQVVSASTRARSADDISFIRAREFVEAHLNRVPVVILTSLPLPVRGRRPGLVACLTRRLKNGPICWLSSK